MLRYKGEIPYFITPRLASFPGLSHAFLTRKGPHGELNFGRDSPDAGERPAANAKLLSREFTFLVPIVLARQVHGGEVLVLDRHPEESSFPSVGDALITDRPQLPLAVLTADCLPIILYDPHRRAVGIVHSGWQGTWLDIAVNTVDALKQTYGCWPQDLLAALGPAIGPCCYSLRGKALTSIKSRAQFSRFCLPRVQGDQYFDILGANAYALRKAGIPADNIFTLGLCTHCRADLFYSYRREGSAAGRQLSFVMLR